MARTAITIPQGTSWGIAWPILDDGEPADLTGWTVLAQVRETAESAEVLHEWGTLRANATVSGGQVTLYVQPTDSATWTWRRGVYDVELTAPDGTVYRISEGPVYVSPEVTR